MRDRTHTFTRLIRAGVYATTVARARKQEGEFEAYGERRRAFARGLMEQLEVSGKYFPVPQKSKTQALQ
jgi:hypothetical protein